MAAILSKSGHNMRVERETERERGLSASFCLINNIVEMNLHGEIAWKENFKNGKRLIPYDYGFGLCSV